MKIPAAIALLLLSASVATAQSQVGLAVGEKAPAFSLEDQNGETRSLDSLLGRGKLAIVFYRSADW